MEIFAICLIIALITLWSWQAYASANSLVMLLKSKKAAHKVATNDLNIESLFNAAVQPDDTPHLSRYARSHVINMEAYAHDRNLDAWHIIYNKKDEMDNIIFFNLFEYVDHFNRKTNTQTTKTKETIYIFRRHHKQLVDWHDIHNDLQHQYAFMNIKTIRPNHDNLDNNPVTTFEMSYGDKMPAQYQDLLADLENHAD